MKIEYNTIDPFQKDFKKLLKKYRTLKEDLETAKRDAIELYHIKHIDNQSVVLVEGFCTEKIQICKIKKFACKALKGRGSRSGIRIIYAFYCHCCKVDFIEMYFKGRKENENRGRIKKYLKDLS